MSKFLKFGFLAFIFMFVFASISLAGISFTYTPTDYKTAEGYPIFNDNTGFGVNAHVGGEDWFGDEVCEWKWYLDGAQKEHKDSGSWQCYKSGNFYHFFGFDETGPGEHKVKFWTKGITPLGFIPASTSILV